MPTRRTFFALLLGLVGTAALFGVLSRLRGGEGGLYCGEEPPLVFGREECPVCKMVVDYPPSAAAMKVRLRGVERWYFFDDVGCLATWHREVENSGGEVLQVCVIDRVEGRWIEAREASLLVTTEFTAMGTGILAVAPQNLERYKRGEASSPWRVKAIGGDVYSPPKPSGEVRKVVSYKCVLNNFHYGPAWSSPPGWYNSC
ncbi:MAG: nitrous oxide reductase accessory protein NosL [Pyrobaculum sp.]